MRERLEKIIGRVSRVHPHAWLWAPLADDPTFVLRPMFGGRAVYLDGRLVLYFSARAEPWRGLLVGTEHAHHPSLQAEFPELTPHPILPRWLYLPESADSFERTAGRLVTLARRRDPRLGVTPKARKKRSPARKARPGFRP